jgi:hypothetical protein
VIEVTRSAAEVLRTALSAARRFAPDAGLRATSAPAAVSVELAEGPQDGDGTLSGDGYTLWVDPALEGVLDVGEHDRFVLRPPGSGASTVG